MGVLLLLSLYYIYNPSLVPFFPKCPFHSLTGFYCAGCGSQRALHALLHLDFLQMIHHNALFLFGILVIGYHNGIKMINKYFKKEYYNYIYHPKAPLLVGIIIILFWILRNITSYPFSVLAP